MLTSFVIALSVAISFHTTGISPDGQMADTPTLTMDVSAQGAVVDNDHQFIYTPFIDGYALPESTLDRIARTA